MNQNNFQKSPAIYTLVPEKTPRNFHDSPGLMKKKMK